jgi:hypothetical protein
MLKPEKLDQTLLKKIVAKTKAISFNVTLPYLALPNH